MIQRLKAEKMMATFVGSFRDIDSSAKGGLSAPHKAVVRPQTDARPESPNLGWHTARCDRRIITSQDEFMLRVCKEELVNSSEKLSGP